MKGKYVAIIIVMYFGILLSLPVFLEHVINARFAKWDGTVMSFGNGVHYFHCTNEKFAKSLSGFIAANPDLEPTTMTRNGTGEHGGYFVIFRKKQ